MEAEPASVTPIRDTEPPEAPPGRFPPAPAAPAPRRTLVEELLLVLSLSLLASAAYALLSFTAAPVNRSVSVAVIPQTPRLAAQLVPIAVAIVPVWLVFYLLRRNSERPAVIGMAWDRPRFDVSAAMLLAVVVGAAGVVVYVASVRLGHNRLVVPVPPLGLWWTIPVLVLSAAQNALLEETIVVGYMVTRLQQIGTPAVAAIATSSVLRGSYHLYQGWGGFTGNFAMGMLFGFVFLKWRRTWPLVIAHTLLDIGAGLLYIAFRTKLPGLLAG
jgi:membrane protease YdiL (CAAX protease family)